MAIWTGWCVTLIASSAVLWEFRGRLDKAHVILVFLLIILGASAAGGRVLGVLLSFVAFFIFDFSFLPPYGTLSVRNPLDWLALVAFLITSLVAAQLLYTARAQRAAVEREAALREAALLKDALLATVSHDLRTPLTSIKGLAHELRQDGDERAAIIEEEADRLNRLVNDLLDVARLNAGGFSLDVQMNALDDLLGAAVRQFEGRPDRHRLHASLDRADEIVVGRFDFVQTLRIVTNLIENALKYSPVDTDVQLTGGEENGEIVVRVADAGPGLPVKEEERVFEPFARVSYAPGDTGSAGLGLSIARGLAEAHGGRVNYERRDVGGSLFTLRLPLA